MAEMVGGGKKQKEEAHGIMDPETKEIVVATEEIKRVSLAHCLKVLQNNPVEEDAALWVKLESARHEAVMEDDSDNETNINKDDFDWVVRKFNLKNKSACYFLTKAGTIFQTSMYKLCKRFIQEEHFPFNFSKTLLKQLWKRKREILDNH